MQSKRERRRSPKRFMNEGMSSEGRCAWEVCLERSWELCLGGQVQRQDVGREGRDGCRSGSWRVSRRWRREA